uniref:Putative secreted protein n=1 Tax=Panstrongylus lignarius TaxID=156445 RepID=A0A224Y428_9HEMI
MVVFHNVVRLLHFRTLVLLIFLAFLYSIYIGNHRTLSEALIVLIIVLFPKHDASLQQDVQKVYVPLRLCCQYYVLQRVSWPSNIYHFR